MSGLMKNNDVLPEGWGWKTLGEIAEVVGGGTPRTNVSDYFNNGKIPWLTPADLSGYQNKFVCHGERFITEEGLKNSSARMMPAGTVLFTSRAPIGYVAIASNPVCTNQGFKSFVLKDGVLSDYVYWYLKGSKNLAESLASGTTFLELTAAKAKQIPIPLASLDQQKLIVSEIEKQFSRLDEAVAALKRVRASLKRYKASVLKAAVEGKLTEEKAKWNETTFGKIISISSGDGLTKTQRNDKGKYLVYGGNGITGRHSEFIYEEEKLIIGRVGVHCGNAYITKPKSWITDNAFVVSFDKKSIDIKFLFHLICFLNLNKYSSSTAQPVISQGKLYPIEISIPEKKEDQQKIVEEIESRLSVAEEIEETININLKRAERLRQAILKKAFSGRLVSTKVQS